MYTKWGIESFLASRRAKGLSKDTIRWYRGILESFGGQYKELPSEPEAIEQFLGALTSGDERRHGYYRALKCFYGFLHRRLNMVNAIELVEAPKRTHKLPRPLSPDELNQLLLYPHVPKTKAVIMFLVDTGARIGELTNLQPGDIAETEWGYTARVTGKTGTRTVPISTEVYSALMKHLPIGLSRYTLRRKVSQAFLDAHVNGSAVNLRHSFGTLWQGDELILQKIMGHSHLSTTLIYRDLRVKLLCEQHNKFSPLRMVYPLAKAML